MTLLTWRFIQAGIRIMRGDVYTIIASHEAEEILEESAAARTASGEKEG